MNDAPEPPTRPTPPIELTGAAARWPGAVEVPASVVAALEAIAPLADDDITTAECSRDWWPLGLHWSLAGQVPARAAVVCRPTTTEQVAAIAAICNESVIPLTVTAGRSGVSGASIPVFGGVVLDITGMEGLVDVDDVSGVAEVKAGTFGADLESGLAQHGLSVGHFPQSFDLATVGGWVACRGAGQYSTRYGKIEDMVVGLEVVLADGRIVRTGGAPAAAVGPDLNHLFTGSEGTLGIITTVWLRSHPTPPAERHAAYTFTSFADGIDACRLVLRAGATPAVMRLYDEVESMGSGRGGDGTRCTLLVLDEGSERIVDATMGVVTDCCGAGEPADAALVAAWLEHRNDTSALQGLTRKGYVVDTMEIAAPWSRLGSLSDTVRAALLAVPHATMASCHLSHSYSDGACLYFTFLAKPPPDEIESTYIALWDSGQRAVLAGGGNLSHHHGIGINRSRFVAEALGAGVDVLANIKQSLDPFGILNPGKLGLTSPFGASPWPAAGR
jgi:alkyldihydroxyacetonephosphate synthase